MPLFAAVISRGVRELDPGDAGQIINDFGIFIKIIYRGTSGRRMASFFAAEGVWR